MNLRSAIEFIEQVFLPNSDVAIVKSAEFDTSKFKEAMSNTIGSTTVQSAQLEIEFPE